VRILSGLYGLLRPLDLMHPYRLEMGTGWPTARQGPVCLLGRHVTAALNQELRAAESPGRW
jgi:cytoplasmic iron level regulating protein YaaA (DUF328/UPF0246 family)